MQSKQSNERNKEAQANIQRLSLKAKPAAAKEQDLQVLKAVKQLPEVVQQVPKAATL